MTTRHAGAWPTLTLPTGPRPCDNCGVIIHAYNLEIVKLCTSHTCHHTPQWPVVLFGYLTYHPCRCWRGLGTAFNQFRTVHPGSPND